MSKSCSRCEACKELKFSSTLSSPKPAQYYYLEDDKMQPSTGNKNNEKIKKRGSRASSAGSVGSNNSNNSSCFNTPPPKTKKHCSKKCKANSETVESRMKKCRSEDDKKKLDPQSVNQLKTDLELIKQQLFTINANRNEALDITNELQVRYTNLAQKNQEQQAEIEKLKLQNTKLSETINQQTDVDDLKKRFRRLTLTSNEQQNEIEALKLHNKKLEDSIRQQNTLDESAVSSIISTKTSLEQCEQKLGSIYNELIVSSKEEIERTKSLLADKDKEVASVQDNFKKARENEEKYVRENKELENRIHELETCLSDTVEQLKQFQNDSLKRENDVTQLKSYYVGQLEEKSKRLDDLSSAVETLQAHVCECKEKSVELTVMEDKYHKLAASHQSLIAEMSDSTETLKEKSLQVEQLKKTSSKIVDEYMAMKSFSEELKNIIKANDLKIAELHNMLKQKDTYLQTVQKEMIAKDKKIEMLSRSQDEAKKEIAELQQQKLNYSKMSPVYNKSVKNYDNINLTEELQELINALYEEIDNTMMKDDQIQKQYQNICCLECKLTSKEKELQSFRNELQLMHSQFARVVREKAELIHHLKQMEALEAEQGPESTFESSECDCE